MWSLKEQLIKPEVTICPPVIWDEDDYCWTSQLDFYQILHSNLSSLMEDKYHRNNELEKSMKLYIR